MKLDIEPGKMPEYKMHKFSLYETASRFILIGADAIDQSFRVLKIDRTAAQEDLVIDEDETVYTKEEINELMLAMDDGNKSSGGAKLRSTTWGLLGFIRFTGEYYMLLITKRRQVAILGGHYVYQIEATELVSLTTAATARFASERSPEEARFVNILNNLDLTRSFYFSCAYDVTNTLQRNVIREREALQHVKEADSPAGHNEMFVWNHHLLEPAASAMRKPDNWCRPIIHGFVDQASQSRLDYPSSS